MTDAKTRMWLLVTLMCAVLHSSHSWSSYTTCNIEENDIKRLEQLCSKTAEEINHSVTGLERKMDRVLSFVDEMRKHESAWIEAASVASRGTVERDVSNRLPEPLEDDDNEAEDTRLEISRFQGRNESLRRMEEEEEEDREEEEKDGEVKKGECEAQVMDNHETIGLFYMTSYRHGHCSNRHPIASPIRHCLGFCATRTFIDRNGGIWSQGIRCQSCQVEQLETLKIPLQCDDGFSFEKAFENVVTCRCQGCQPHKD